MLRRTRLILSLLLLACLDAPRWPDAAHVDSPPAGPRILDLRIEDFTGRAWPIEAAPRWPRLRLSTSEPLEDTSTVLVLSGPLDDALLEDLAAPPLRTSTIEREIAVDVERTDDGLLLTPAARLEGGASIAVAVVAWARGSQSSLRIGSAWARSIAISSDARAGAELAGSWPPDGAAAVAPQLAAIALRFDGDVGALSGISLFENGSPLAATATEAACDGLGFAAGSCVRLAPSRSLSLGAAYRVEISSAMHDATGAPIGPASVGFSTASSPDVDPPQWLGLECAIDEVAIGGGCIFSDDSRIALRVQIDEPVSLHLVLGGRDERTLAPRGEARFELADLPPDVMLAGTLEAIDTAGLTSMWPLEARTAPPLPTISISEVRADPRGAEPRQEYVEIVNWGPSPVDLLDLSLSDSTASAGDTIAQPWSLAPGQRALLVSDDFDPEDPADAPVPAGVPLVRIDRSLGSGGLSNTGEPIFLRDSTPHRISAAPALAVPEGQCLVRVGSDRRSGDAGQFAAGPCTPGAP